MKRFKFEDINDGYTFEVSDAEGLVGTISVELKTFMEDQAKQIAELKEGGITGNLIEKIEKQQKEIAELKESKKQHAIDFMKWDDKGDRYCRNIPQEDYERIYETFIKQALK